MPLDATGLKHDLQAIAEHPPATVQAAAQAWAQAMATYASNGLVPPTTAAAAAATALQAALATAFATSGAAAAMETAFATFATAVAGGMLPAFVGTPPAGPVGFAALFAVKRPTALAGANAVGGAVDAWMKTGTAVPVPPGATVLWS